MIDVLQHRRRSPSRRFTVGAAALALSLFAAAQAAGAQALPAAEASPISTGFTLPRLGGSLNYAVSAAQSFDWGYYGNRSVAFGTNISGDVAYMSSSTIHPFSAVISAGHTFGSSGEPSYTFANVGLSQAFNVRRWNFVLSDSMNYVPSTPTSGLSGVPGLGDLGVPPIQTGPDSGLGLLTNYSPEINNTAGGSVLRQITGKTSINATGSYAILRFVNGVGSTSGGFGLENDMITGSAGFNHRMSARNSFGGNYAYSSFIYLNNSSNGVPELNFVTQTASFTFSHQVNRKVAINLAAGPQWTQINSTQNSASLNGYGDASITYSGEINHASLAYVRTTNSGYGVIGGGLSDSVMFAAGRVIGRVWALSTSAGFTHMASLPTPNAVPYNFDTVSAGVQANRALARSLSCFASYTAQHQTQNSSSATVDLFTGTNQIFSIGVTYAPASRRFGGR